MRLVHEYNREKVERYLHKRRLEKIAVLEELDRRGELSDRSILSLEYEYESSDQMRVNNEIQAEEYLKKALQIHLDMFEPGVQSEAENVSYYYCPLGSLLKALGENAKSTSMYQKAEKYTLLAQKQRETDMKESSEAMPELSPEEIAAIFERIAKDCSDKIITQISVQHLRD